MNSKSTSFKIIIAVIVLALIVAAGYFFLVIKNPAEHMTLNEALEIAQRSNCTEQGTLTENSFYNKNSKTWWVDLYMRPEFAKEGCNPACVIWEETGQTEINWRCTGLIVPEDTETAATLFSLEEISQHNLSQDCWMAIDNKVYDVTPAINMHPGGKTILEGCGTNATELFNTKPGSGLPHSVKAFEDLNNYLIGQLKND